MAGDRPLKRWTIEIVEWPTFVAAGVERGAEVEMYAADDLPGLYDQLADAFEDTPDGR
jgi:hypothetical protein